MMWMRHWRKHPEHQWVPSNSENEVSSDAELSVEGDDDEVDFVDWDALEQKCGLLAWDRLGEGYEANAAQIGVFSYYPIFLLYL